MEVPTKAAKAVVISEYGKPADVLKLQENRDLPALQDEDVLVAVHASSVNPIDWKLTVGYVKAFFPLSFPTVLGYDFSGVILALGPAAAKEGRLSVGQTVWGDSGIRGCYATHAVVPAKYVDAKPQNLSHVEAATLPLVALTSYQALKATGLTEGQTVLILGASGGVGFTAVYIAKALGLHVIATCSERNVEFVTKLGADRVIDYSKEDWSQTLRAADEDAKTVHAIFDTVGDRDGWARAPGVLKRGASYIAVAGAKGEGSVEAQDGLYTYKFLITQPNHLDLGVLREMVESGRLRAHVDSVFPLEDVVGAMERNMAGKVVGKVAVQIVKQE